MHGARLWKRSATVAAGPVFNFILSIVVFAGIFMAQGRAIETPTIGELRDLPAMTGEQREALDYLEEVAADPSMHVTFRQQPGDIVFMNNWITFHRRNAFEDYEDLESRRHILRVWLSMPNSRPIDPMFAGNYGATEAGAIRGGMPASGS